MRRGFAFPIRGIFLALLAVTGIFMLARSTPTDALPWISLYSTSLSNSGASALSDRVQTTTMVPPAGFFSGAPGTAGYYFNTVMHITPHGFKLYDGGDVPDGTHVANNNSIIFVGAFNGPCASLLPVPLPFGNVIQLFDSTTDDSSLIAHAAGFADGNGDGLFDAVTQYPVTVDALFPQAAVGAPSARAYGRTNLLGALVAVHFLTYPAGTFAFQGVPASLGKVTVSFAVTGDPGVPTAGAVSDACTLFQSTNRHFGVSRDNANTAADESGLELSRNPTTPGTYQLGNYSLPVRDLDDDGVENSLDTCPYIPNVDLPVIVTPGFPLNVAHRVNTGPDGDGIDSACDPAPGVNNGLDADGDGFVNRLDVCPLVYDPSQLETEANNPTSFESDLGSKTDSIGDACDLNIAQADGHYHTTAAGGASFPACIATTTCTSGPQCDVNVTCGHICLGPYVFVPGALPAPDLSSPPVGCTTFNPAGCTGAAGQPCTPPAAPPIVFAPKVIGAAHDVQLSSLGGPQNINQSPATKNYTASVTNKGSVAENIQVALRVDAVAAGCTVNGGALSQTQTAVAAAVPAGGSANVTFSVTFDGCGGSASPAYVVTADACHEGDAAPAGFFGVGACPGVFDGTPDGNPLNDAPKTKAVDQN